MLKVGTGSPTRVGPRSTWLLSAGRPSCCARTAVAATAHAITTRFRTNSRLRIFIRHSLEWLSPFGRSGWRLLAPDVKLVNRQIDEAVEHFIPTLLGPIHFLVWRRIPFIGHRII